MSARRRDLEADLVRGFAAGIGRNGLEVAPSVRIGAFIAGHEVSLAGASQLGNHGSADLLMVTADGRWWIVEAKLSHNGECQPSFVFGNQLARYAKSMETLGLGGLHPRLESYFYGRRSALRPPDVLQQRIELARDLTSVLAVWCDERGLIDPPVEAARLVSMLADQLSRRTITLAALVDAPDGTFVDWIGEQRGTRSLALLTVAEGQPRLLCDGTIDLVPPRQEDVQRVLPPFDHIPQTYKPTPRTLPRVLAPEAYALFAEVLEPRLRTWTAEAWPDVEIGDVSSASFSVYLQGRDEREICLQIGRGSIGGGGGAGAHPLKLIVNLIWAAEQVYGRWATDRESGEDAYRELERLLEQLCTSGGMLVRGVGAGCKVLDVKWWDRVRTKLRGDEKRRPEILAVREIKRTISSEPGRPLRQEGYGWPEGDPIEDRRLLSAALNAVELWLGAAPYSVIRRRDTARRVPGSV